MQRYFLEKQENQDENEIHTEHDKDMFFRIHSKESFIHWIQHNFITKFNTK